VNALLQRLPHGVLDRFEKRERHRPEHLAFQPKFHAGVDRSRLDTQPDGCEKRIWLLAEYLDGCAGADGPFDADCRCFAEVDVDVEVVGQRCWMTSFCTSP
jgi:hypothetical protein